MGTTTGNWPVINAAYSVANSRQFIAKLRADLSGYVYSTTFGTNGALNPNISPVAFLVDNCENVYVSGWGGGANNFGGGYPSAGTAGMPVTPDAFQRNTDGSDFYFFVLQKNAASQLYGSFFGQLGGGGALEHVDGGTSRFDATGTIYQAMCANCKNVASSIKACVTTRDCYVIQENVSVWVAADRSHILVKQESRTGVSTAFDD